MLALAVLNIYPEWLGLSHQLNGQWVHVPFLTDNFWRFLPLINIQWALSLVLAFYLVVRGTWQTWSKWADVAIKAFGMVIVFLLISAGPLVGVSPEAWAASGWGQEAMMAMQNNVFPLVNISIQVGLGITLLVQGVEIIKDFKITRGVPVVEVKS